ncbi:hypothetical protein Vretifemale_17834, partial [Volvox reticuliferus]
GTVSVDDPLSLHEVHGDPVAAPPTPLATWRWRGQEAAANLEQGEGVRVTGGGAGGGGGTSTSVALQLQDLPPEVMLQICDHLPLATCCGALPATCRWVRDVLSGGGRQAPLTHGSAGPGGVTKGRQPSTGGPTPSPAEGTLLAGPGGASSSASEWRWPRAPNPGKGRRVGDALPYNWWQRRAIEELMLPAAAVCAIETAGVSWRDAVLARVRLRGAPPLGPISTPRMPLPPPSAERPTRPHEPRQQQRLSAGSAKAGTEGTAIAAPPAPHP